jgi:DNA segregation ATPase FtsK/SpoIIIE, S-DNA-T family
MSQVKQPAGAASKKTASNKPTVTPPAVPARQPAPGTLADEMKSDLVTELWLRFGRFGWDAAGVGLIAFALITLVGLVGHSINQPWAQGFFISFWVNLIAQAFGWGWPLAVLAISLMGLVCMRRRLHWPDIPLVRVLALEGLAFCLLTFLAIIGGFSLERAEAGKDGGFIGWGLATLLDQLIPIPWGAVFVIILMILFAGYGSGLMHWGLRRLEGWLNWFNPGLPAVPAAASKAPPPLPAASQNNHEEEEAPPAPAIQIPLVRDPNLPPLNLLLSEENVRPDEGYIQETAQKIEKTLAEFGVPASVKGYRVGPTITQYAVEPGFVEKPGPDGEMIRQKVRVSQISALSRDLALSLSAERLRIEAPVPGRAYMGIEVPNPKNALVRLRSLMESEAFLRLTSPLAVALGKDVSGQPVVADLTRMPHLLIAGTTGSGKSVFIAALAACLAINNQPEDMRMAMLDPKMVELVRFNGLPHLLGRVETSVDRMLAVLRWALVEMDRRYRLLEDARTRDIDTYNRKIVKRGQPKLPKIVVIVDELADLMMTAPDQTEHNLIRLAQMARATGIHLVVATQRPSTDVVTGLIKANFPARLAFSVASSIDSRVILDGSGAESLLGKGDMLFLNPEAGTPIRAQGVLVADEELERVISFWKQRRPLDGAIDPPPWEALLEQSEAEENSDALVEQAIKIVRASQRASTSLIQRRLRIGYPRAARLMDQLEELGVVGPSQGGGKERDVLLPPDDHDEDAEDSSSS